MKTNKKNAIAKFLFEDKWRNYSIAIVFVLIIFKILDASYQTISEYYKNDTLDTIVHYVFLLISVFFVYNSKETALPRKEKHIIDPFNGESNVWFKGLRFLLYLYRGDEHNETIDLEQHDIEIPAFKCQDNDGLIVLINRTNIDWENIETDEARAKFKHAKQADMDINIQSLVKQAIIRLAKNKKLHEDILPQNFGKAVATDRDLADAVHHKYGVKIVTVSCEIESGNMDIEAKGRIAEKLHADFKAKYRDMPDSEIARLVNVRLFGAKENNVYYNGGRRGGSAPFVKIDADK